MRVIAVPCLADNYAYVFWSDGSERAVVVDPSEWGKVEAVLQERGLKLEAVLLTHHHYDHVGGLSEMAEKHKGVRVWAHASDRGRIEGQTEGVEHGEVISVAGIAVRARHVPGHTLGAVAWEAEGEVFTGDTLFLGGCGRLFEGTAAGMFQSLNEVLGELPGETRVWCGHEYTVRNLEFARSVMPWDQAVIDALGVAVTAREAGRETVPGTMEREREVNLFLRCDEAALGESLGVAGGGVGVFAALRARRDKW